MEMILEEGDHTSLAEYICTSHGDIRVHYIEYYFWFWIKVDIHDYEYHFSFHENGKGGVSNMQSEYLGIMNWYSFPDGLTPENAAEKLKGWLNWL
jgi:hypothetical protein